MKSISFILHFVFVLCLPAFAAGGGVSSATDSLYRRAVAEHSVSAYCAVLDNMIDEDEHGIIYEKSLRELEKLAHNSKDWRVKAALSRYQAHGCEPGSRDFLNKLIESKNCYAAAHDKEGEAGYVMR